MTGYSTDFQAIWDALINTIVSTTTFTSTNTSGAFYKSWQGVTYPICTVRPREDKRIEEEVGGVTERRLATFRVEIRSKGTGLQDDQDTIIGYVGEIKDAIVANSSLGCTTVPCHAYDFRVEYSQQGQGKSAVIFFAVMEVQVLWARIAS